MKAYLIPAAAALAISGCTLEAEKTPDTTATCRPEAAARLEGKAAPSDQEIMALTGASVVRRAPEGQPLTMDFLPFRITVLTDASGKKILRASCS
ncbi:hypothetical protein [Paenirhodobacter sp.]|uniref:hypothetical protein n=1 Tax=Paenirhodobacter sp. TaxID=1965326 RepID=UPI003B3D70EE